MLTHATGCEVRVHWHIESIIIIIIIEAMFHCTLMLRRVHSKNGDFVNHVNQQLLINLRHARLPIHSDCFQVRPRHVGKRAPDSNNNVFNQWRAYPIDFLISNERNFVIG